MVKYIKASPDEFGFMSDVELEQHRADREAFYKGLKEAPVQESVADIPTSEIKNIELIPDYMCRELPNSILHGGWVRYTNKNHRPQLCTYGGSGKFWYNDGNCCYERYSVTPILNIIDLSKYGYKNFDKVEYLDNIWYVLNNYSCLLSCDPIGQIPYVNIGGRPQSWSFDDERRWCNYDTSYAKQYLEDWLKDRIADWPY